MIWASGCGDDGYDHDNGDGGDDDDIHGDGGDGEDTDGGDDHDIHGDGGDDDDVSAESLTSFAAPTMALAADWEDDEDDKTGAEESHPGYC